jgi:hypothetical protein
MATLKHITIIHPTYGEVLNETFMDEIQFKLFLTLIHSSIALKQDLSTFNGKDFLIHIPTNILKECLVVGNTKEVSPGEIVMAKSKMES